MRLKKLHMYGIVLTLGIVLGSMIHSQTMEDKKKEAVETVNSKKGEKEGEYIAMKSLATVPRINQEGNVFQSSYEVPYGWYIKVKPEPAKDSSGRNYKFIYSSYDSEIAKVDSKGKVTGVGEGDTFIIARSKDNPKEIFHFQVQVRREYQGWHNISGSKKYYVKGNGKRAVGYTLIEGEAYYFDKETSYCLMKKWQYVRLHGKKYKMYFDKKGRRSMDVTGILPKSARYQLAVNLSDNVVTAYAQDGKNGYIIPAKIMLCSGGMKGHETITGSYPVLRKAGRWHILRYNSHGQYATRIRGPYLFHSVTYDRYGDHYSLQEKEYKKLGKSASHGCIRLQVKDAKWIYDNSSRCSARLYRKKGEKIPFFRPEAEKIGKTKSGKYYDRTDSAR